MHDMRPVAGGPSAVMELRPRLRAIAERVLPGLPVADLCCDHARLAASLVESGRVPHAIAVDINRPPLEAAARMLDDMCLRARVQLREGDGFSALAPGEVATVVLAGIGASLAERLLEAGAASGRLLGVRRMIVQVNHNFPLLGSLRGTIDGLGWSLIDECIVRDQGRLYVILVAEPGGLGLRDAVDRELGPILRRGDDPLWQDWLTREHTRVRRACATMQGSRAEGEQLATYRAFLAMLETASLREGPGSGRERGPETDRT
jgi:tRNA (adenine22-N1)-methyltransferase